METNPVTKEVVQTDAELLAELEAEYRSLSERRQYVASLIAAIAERIVTKNDN